MAVYYDGRVHGADGLHVPVVHSGVHEVRRAILDSYVNERRVRSVYWGWPSQTRVNGLFILRTVDRMIGSGRIISPFAD